MVTLFLTSNKAQVIAYMLYIELLLMNFNKDLLKVMEAILAIDSACPSQVSCHLETRF